MGLLERLGWRKASSRLVFPEGAWGLVALGNPGEAYAHTRHNLGRLLLQRWMAEHCPRPGSVHPFRNGTLYGLPEPFLAFVPGTWMNLSGQLCAEAVAAGFDPARLLVLHDDKDLPLGRGRFRLEGGDGGHNGLRSVLEALGTEAVPRLRLGIGPFVRPLDQFVLGAWSEEEWDRIEALDAPFARFMDLLAQGTELRDLPGVVNAAAFWDPESP